MCLATITNCPAVSEKQGPVKSLAPRRRRFRFAPEVSQVVGNVLSRNDFTAKERKSYWYTKKEQAACRDACTNLVHDARETQDDVLGQLTDNAYNAARELRFRTIAANRALDDPSRYTQHFEKEFIESDVCWGLGRLTSSTQQFGRQSDALKLRMTVIGMYKNKHNTPEDIAAECFKVSLPSRLYARIIGHVQAKAVCPSQSPRDLLNLSSDLSPLKKWSGAGSPNRPRPIRTLVRMLSRKSIAQGNKCC